MTQQHPITPPPELIAKWMTEARFQDYCSITEQVAYRTAQWVYEQCGQVNEAKLQQARDQEPEGPTDEGLIQRLLLLAEQAVKEALDFEYEDPEDRYIWRELQELKQLAKKGRSS